MAGTPSGFDYTERGGEVSISHRGRHATTLRGRAALGFLDDVDRGDPQELMARVTGQYRHGNERMAKNHPRNPRPGRA